MIIYQGLKRRKIHDFITLSFYRETLFPFAFYSGFSVFFLIEIVQNLAFSNFRHGVSLDAMELGRFTQLIGGVGICIICGERVVSVLRHTFTKKVSFYFSTASYIALIMCLVGDNPLVIIVLLFSSVHAALITTKQNAPVSLLFGLVVLVIQLMNQNLVEGFVPLAAFALFKSLFFLGESYDRLYRKAANRLNDSATMVASLSHENTQLHERFEISVRNIISDERTRIAREIHDTIGHSLTSLLRQVEILEALNRHGENGNGSANAEQAKQLKNFNNMLRSSIDDMRLEVRSLRKEREQSDWLQNYDNLCNTFSESAHVDVKFLLYDTLPNLPDKTGRGVYRIIQEALTNSLRHGHAHDVQVMMGMDEKKAMMYLKISDNGLGATMVKPGNGLSGIMERAEQMGGYVAWRTEYLSGFDLGVEIPLADTDER